MAVGDKLKEDVIKFNASFTHECSCKHDLIGTGGIFFQSVGLLRCASCNGWQRIRKPIA